MRDGDSGQHPCMSFAQAPASASPDPVLISEASICTTQFPFLSLVICVILSQLSLIA